GEPKEGWFPDQRLTIEEAIEAYTKGPAWASFEEARKGTLAPGKLADITVFDTDLVEVGRTDPASLLKAEVLYTITGGRVVYEAPRRVARLEPSLGSRPRRRSHAAMRASSWRAGRRRSKISAARTG